MTNPAHTPENDATVTLNRTVFTPTARSPVQAVLERFSPEDRLRLRRILSEPIEYLVHPKFDGLHAVKDFYGEANGRGVSAKPWCNASEPSQPTDHSAMPAATLTTEKEQQLFLRMNYARFRMATILQRFATKRLTAKAAEELLGWHAEAITARCEIVQANVPLVLAMAKRTRLGSVDYAELISEGNMALLRSVDKFDCGRGFKFSTYACRAILKSFSRVASRSSRYRGRFPTEFDPSLERSDHLELQRVEAEADCVDELRCILERNTADLNEVEARVLQARFALGQVEGMDGEGPKTLEQVGLLIGVTKERVRQIQNRALQKLRSKLQEDFLAA